MSSDTQVSEDAVVIGRDDVSDFNEDNILPQPASVQDSIRSWLKPTSYDAENGEFKKHLASYLPGTGEWLLESPTFREWHASKTQGMLWIKGIPGSGKSVIASSLVNHLSKEGAPVLYFFFRQIIDANHTPDALLRDWLAQLLSYSPPLQLQLKESIDKRQSLGEMSMATMWQHIKSAMIYIPKLYCVVDALDEMDSNQEAFLQALAELGKWRPSRVKIIITSRPVPKVERPLRQESILHVRLDEKHVDEDIANYVAHHLNKTPKALTTEQKEVIKRAVPGRANGLFLYAKLAMDAFLEQGADVEDVLKTLPIDLNVMYTGLLREHARRSGVPHDLQLLILSFVTHASRPLRLLEIAEMIRITEETQAKAIGSLENLKDLVRAACGPLLEILPDETVCVIHHSFTEFLNGSTRSAEPHDQTYPILEMNSTHNRLSLACLSYLLSGCLGEVKLPADDDYDTDSEWGDRYYVTPTVNKDLRLNYPFLAYSMDNWHVHARKADGSGPLSDELYDTISTLLSEKNFEPLSVLVENGGSGRAPIHTVALLGLSQFLARFIDTDNLDIDLLDSKGESAIFHAAKAGHSKVVKVLLDLGAEPDEPSDYDGKRPLHKAAENDHGEVVTLLLEAGVDPLTTKTKCDPGLMCGDPYKFIGHTPLMYAMSGGNASAARAFLPYLKTAETASKALGWAVGSRNRYSTGCPAVLDELLQHPLVDVNRLVRGQTPLYIATRVPNTEMVLTLLKAGADPTVLSASQGDEFCREGTRRKQAKRHKGENRTPLHGICGAERCVSIGGRDDQYQEPEFLHECLSLMLKAGAEVNAKDMYGCTPLHYAVRWWPNAARALLQAGADVHAVRVNGGTPLHDCKSLESLRILVEEANADINHQRESDGKTALLKMADMYNKPPRFDVDNIRLHVDLGADLTLTAHDGRGALHEWIARSRDRSAEDESEALDMLLSSGIPLNGADKQGKTVLHTMNGLGQDLGLMSKLVAAGADLNARDHQGRTPIFYFIEEAYRNVNMDEFVSALDKLLAMGARLDVLDYRGFNLLFILMSGSHFGQDTTKVINELVRRGLDPKAVDYQGNTLFHEVVAQTTRDFDSPYLDIPLKLGVNADQQNYAGQSALHLMMTPRDRPCSRGMKYFENPDVKDNDGIRPLHVAVRSDEGLALELLSKGASPTEPTLEGMTPLHVAARFRKPGIAGLLMEAIESKLGKQGLVDHLNRFHGQVTPTALHLACRSGVPETVALLLAAGADPNAKSGKVGSPLESCTQYELENALWDTGDDENSLSNDSVSSRSLSQEATSGIKIRSRERNKTKNDDGWATELEKVLSLLRSYRADFMSKTEGGKMTTLDLAISKCKSTHDYTIECLVRLRQSIEDDNGDQSAEKTRCDAAHQESEALDLRKYTLSLVHNEQQLPSHLVHKISASVSRRYATQETFRQLAPWRGITEEELGWGAVKGFFNTLIEQHDWESIKHVLRQKPRLFDMDDGDNILDLLMKHGLGSIVRAVLTRVEVLQVQTDRDDALRRSREEGEDLLTYRQQQFNPLRVACERSTSNMAMVRCLVDELGVDVNDGYYRWSDSNEEVGSYERISNALHECCRGDYWWKVAEALPYLIEHGANLESRDGLGRTALVWALEYGSLYQLRVVQTLVEAGADVNAVDKDGKSCLSKAGNNIEITLMLLRHGATGSVEAIASSIASCNSNVLQTLLDAGADPNYFHVPPEGLPALTTGWLSADKSQLPPVFLAAICHGIDDSWEKGDPLTHGSIVKSLLDHGADPFATFVKRNEPQDDDFMTQVVVIHQVLREGGLSRHFLEMPDLDLEYRNPEGMTLLLAACSSRVDPDVAIDDVYFNFNSRNYTPPNATEDRKPGQSTAIGKLLEKGASITARDHRQRNALHLILSVPHYAGYESLRLILSKAPELLHQTDADGLTPFHYALRRVPPALVFGQFSLDIKAIEMLLEAGADPHQLDPNGDSALHHVGKFLALNDTVPEEGNKLRELFKHLVSLGLPINGCNNKGETPAFSVLVCPMLYSTSPKPPPPPGELKAQEILIEMGADLRAVNNAKETLLHLVAGTESTLRGRGSCMISSVIECRFKWLLDQGLDPMAEDEKSRTCLDVAAAKENDKILAMFKRPEE